MKTTKQLFNRRAQRTRGNVKKNNSGRPRLAVFRSGKHIYAQVIDDDGRTTIVSALTDTKKGKTMTQKASEAGKEIAKKAIEKKIKEVVFDRGGFLYAGKIKAFADSAREGGLKF